MINKDKYLADWKALNNKKQATNGDFLAHFILKAIWSKNANKQELLDIFVKKAFNADLHGRREGLQIAFWSIRNYFKKREEYLEQFLNDEEITLFLSLLEKYRSPFKGKNYYSYIFVRQDISNEQQLVQASHVTCVLGKHLPEGISPESLYFVVVGVKGVNELIDVKDDLIRQNKRFVDFIEPDIGNELTAVATLPIHEDFRGNLKKYKLLKFK